MELTKTVDDVDHQTIHQMVVEAHDKHDCIITIIKYYPYAPYHHYSSEDRSLSHLKSNEIKSADAEFESSQEDQMK